MGQKCRSFRSTERKLGTLGEEAVSPAPFEGRPDVCPQLGEVIIALRFEFPLWGVPCPLFYELLDTRG